MNLPCEIPTRSYKDRVKRVKTNFSSFEMAQYTLRSGAQFKEIEG